MFNHENRIPPPISRIAFYSIPFFMIDSLVCYIYEYYRLSALLALVSITSIAYWNSPKKWMSSKWQICPLPSLLFIMLLL